MAVIQRKSLDRANSKNSPISFSASYRVGAVKERLNGYVPIAIFLAIFFNKDELAKKLVFYDPKLASKAQKLNLASLVDQEEFVVRLMESVVQYEENKVFELIFSKTVNWDVYFSECVINVYLL